MSNDTGTSSFATFSGLKTLEDQLVVSNSEIAVTLVAKFFSPLPLYLTTEDNTSYSQLAALAITEDDIENVILKANFLKGPEYD